MVVIERKTPPTDALLRNVFAYTHTHNTHGSY